MFRFCDVSIRTRAKPWGIVVGLLLALVLSTGNVRAAGADDGTIGRTQVAHRVAALTALGRQMFTDPLLSASGRMSCATCHSPSHAFGPPNALAVQLGGKDMRQSGLRAVPSLEYLQATPPFTEHFFDSDDEGDDSVDNGPTGGLTWDGRVDRGRDQARLPLLSPIEMANDGPAAVVAAVERSAYADLMRRAFSAAIFADVEKAFDGAGKAKLTAAEARGLAIFNDPAKGNCAHCHISARRADGAPPQFTDYGLAALGVPRNPEIA